MLRRFASLAPALVLAALLAACSGDGSDDSATALHFLHAEPDPVAGGRIVDGPEVLLRGVNVNAYAEYWQGTEFPTTFPLTEEDAARMQAIGWNAVRLLLSWSRVEPEAGVYDEAYLDEIEGAVRLLERHGIYSILDLHQDAWNATLAARPDEECAPPTEPAIGWDGAPAWATFDGDRPRCTSAGVRETSPAVVAAFDAFWRDVPGPGDVGIRTRYARMLGHLAARFATDPAVAGYDLMNEPNAFTPSAQAGLPALYGEALAEIRAAEAAAGAPSHLVLFEPSGLWSALGQGAPPDFARDRDVVYAPHVYTPGFTGSPITRAAFQVARDEAVRFGGAPVLSGEWGADPRRAGPSGDGYFLDHQAFQDELRFSATLWTWRESCGDPHKVGDVRAGRVPYPWGEFDLDCSTNAVLGERTDLVDELTRAYPRAAPGRLVETRYDPAAGTLFVSGEQAGEGVELVVFYPGAKHGAPEVESSGLDDVESQETAGGGLLFTARASGGAWSLALAP